ncbi:MAG: hypothetical protein AB7P76_12735 [Candidatus Melainabacteria bacterium]
MPNRRHFQFALAGLLSVALLAGGSMLLSAQAADCARPGVGINHRQANQFSRIQHGIRNGSITRAEARNLFQGQRNLRQAERRFRADGHLSASERGRLQRMANVQNRKIIRQAHDGDRRHNRLATRW